MKYLDLVSETGRWYVSEGYYVATNATPKEKKEMDSRNEGDALRRILAGPFESKEDAELAAASMSRQITPNVWQCR